MRTNLKAGPALLALALALALAPSLRAQPGHGPISGGAGGGGGVSGLTTADGGDALRNNCIVRGDGTEGIQCSDWDSDDSGNWQIEGTADAFEGNLTFADPTADWTVAFSAAGRAVFPEWLSAVAFVIDGSSPETSSQFGDVKITNSRSLEFSNGVDYGRGITGAGVTGPVVKVTSALNLSPLASPPRTCDATAEGDIYSDTSHALCFCDGTSWNVLTGSGAGTCA